MEGQHEGQARFNRGVRCGHCGEWIEGESDESPQEAIRDAHERSEEHACLAKSPGVSR